MKRIFTAVLLSLFGIISLSAQVRIYTPELSLPANGSINQVPDALLDWNAVTGGGTGIIQYEIQLADNPDLTNPQVFTTEFVTALQTSNLQFGLTYYWRVRAIDGNDISDWTDTWSFTVLKRISPIAMDNPLSQLTDVGISWDSITGLTQYEYQIDTINFWKQVDAGVSYDFNGIAALDDQHIWAVGAGGKILFFDGTSWTNQVSGVTADLNDVYFIDASNGYAVGNSGTVLYFDGTSWSAQNSGTVKNLKSVTALDNSNIWACGEGGTIISHTDTSWVEQSSTVTKNLFRIFFLDATNGWACGQSGTILYYNGTAWSALVSGTTRDLYGISYSDPGNGWVAGKGGELRHYINSGWEKDNISGFTKDYTNLVIKDGIGYVTGKNGQFLTYDGASWYIDAYGSTSNMNDVAIAGDTRYIVGEGGIVYKYQPIGFSSPLAVIQTLPPTQNEDSLFNLDFGTTYFWRVRGSNISGNTEWSGVSFFSTLSKVTLTKPNNGSSGTDLFVILRWNGLSSRSAYQVQVSDEPTFSVPVQFNTSQDTLNLSVPAFGQKSYWRVKAYHTLDMSDWSDAWDFTTINQLNLTEPANGTVEVSLNPVLKWDPVVGIDKYQVQLALDNTFANPLVDETSSADTNIFSVPVPLQKGMQYFWRARAYTGILPSDWSAIWSFTTIAQAGINDPVNAINMAIYPNPAKDKLWLQLETKGIDTYHISINDLLGKSVLESNLSFESSDKTSLIDVSSINEGIYIMRISNETTTITKKLIINR